MNTIELNLNGFPDFEQLKQTVEDQAEIIRKQELQITRIEDTLHQLLAGLFNHEKQSGTLNMHSAVLEGNEEIHEDEYSDHSDYYKQWPTTRQCDDLEKRMTELEKKFIRESGGRRASQVVMSERMDKIISHIVCGDVDDRLNKLEEQISLTHFQTDNQDDLCCTQCASKPISVLYNSDGQCLRCEQVAKPELFYKNYEVSDKLSDCSEERRKNSASLCGNE